MTKQDRELLRNRICFICRQPIPEAKGVYVSWLRLLVCQSEPCQKSLKHAEKDRSKSRRGRYRSESEAKAILREQTRKAIADILDKAIEG